MPSRKQKQKRNIGGAEKMTYEKDQIKFKELTKVHGRLRNEAKDLFS